MAEPTRKLSDLVGGATAATDRAFKRLASRVPKFRGRESEPPPEPTPDEVLRDDLQEWANAPSGERIYLPWLEGEIIKANGVSHAAIGDLAMVSNALGFERALRHLRAHFLWWTGQANEPPQS